MEATLRDIANLEFHEILANTEIIGSLMSINDAQSETMIFRHSRHLDEIRHFDRYKVGFTNQIDGDSNYLHLTRNDYYSLLRLVIDGKAIRVHIRNDFNLAQGEFELLDIERLNLERLANDLYRRIGSDGIELIITYPYYSFPIIVGR